MTDDRERTPNPPTLGDADLARRVDLERERLHERFTRHERAVLHFSGGKDSLACLLLLRPWWDRLIVMWCNTGDAFPETVAFVRQVQAAVPHFREVRSYVRPFIELRGWPVDALSYKHTEPMDAGPRLNRTDRPLMQFYEACCLQNIWVPMYAAALEDKLGLVFRGTRRADATGKPRSTPGSVLGGIEYQFPIWEWSDAEVWAFLEAEGVDLPPHFRAAPETTSLDCMHCTAWWKDGAPGQLRVLDERHPETHREVVRRLKVIRESLAMDLADLDCAIGLASEGHGNAIPGT